MEAVNEPVVVLQNISKKFGGIFALNQVNFDLRNEIHSIVGHNGAGKSTLVRILMGAIQPDDGEIYLNGSPVSFDSPREAQENRISMVWQELSNFPNLTVTENLLMQRFVTRTNGSIDWKASHDLCKQFLQRLNLDIDPKSMMGKLSLAQQQLVEFSKALSYDPAVLILDEPTSALSFREQEILYEKIIKIKSQGVAVVFISHKLDEIMTLSDRVTVLRDGQKIFTRNGNELDKDSLVEAIVGKPSERKKERIRNTGKGNGESNTGLILEVKNLNLERRLENVSFSLHAGEILGITGVSGSGISDVGKILFGIEQEYSGEISLEGQPYKSLTPQDAVRQGFGYVPKDRKEEGIIPGMTVGDNIVLSTLKQIYMTGFVDNRIRDEVIYRIMDIIDLKPRNPEIAISSLSGGNQQKVVMARWISKKTRVLILDEPTRGVDVGAIGKIYSLIRDLTHQGVSVIVISSEFEEIHSVADRMLVFNKGRIVGEIKPASSVWEDAFALAIK